METPEIVEVNRPVEPVVEPQAEPVEQTENSPELATDPVKAEGTEEPKPEEKKPEEENSVIRQMRKQLRQQQKMIAELKQATQAIQQPEPVPVRENYANDAEYIRAEVAYQTQKAMQAAPKAPDVFESKFAEAKKAHPDFEEALEDISHVQLPVAETRQAVEVLQYGSDVLYHIAKNPDLAEELSILPPAAYAARLGEIHADIKRAKTTKPISKAPAPITPVSGAPKPAEKSYDEITDQAEFNARRRREKEAYMRARFGA